MRGTNLAERCRTLAERTYRDNISNCKTTIVACWDLDGVLADERSLLPHAREILERFDSDKTIVYVCEKCGMFGIYDNFKDLKYCTKCGGNVDITPIELSYAFKLLLDELKSMCIYPQLKLKSKY